ncbi:hypothetical protein [Nocardia sp. BMG51109]|uniref:restriction system modified-DNA reader domain-containing protein n=1 Tax=Nocardia sp. BMG51109 TaxID=1056816 RepID=UPI000464B02D|nr:hypothetical protein [Nocardia sp. BMG51109]
MRHTIVVEDEVFNVLVQHRRGFEQPNDVLRRLLITGDVDPVGSDNGSNAGNTSDGFAPSGESNVYGTDPLRPGRLAQLIDAGLIAAGDQLRHERIRRGQTLEAVVTANGCLQTKRGVYEAPSPALRELVGSQIDGWKAWVHVRSGKSLRELRDSLR